jgi:ABC-type Co2+ transport system permease subunit
MKRILLASVFSGALFVAACTTPEISDAQAVVTDAQTILATGLIPPPVSTIAALVVAGLQALVDSAGASVTSGANAESTALAALTAAVTQVKTNSTAGTTVYNAATAALAALATISANTSASAQAQIEAAVGTVLIDYLEANAPVSAVPGAAPSAVQKAINDARAHISNLQLVH